MDKFWEILDERLELCKEALMVRHNLLLGTTSDVSPIHWQHGGIARLKKGEKIDSLDDLKSDSITKIAIGDPESVPAGKYAKEVLDNTKLYDAVQSKLVLGKDVKQVLSYVQQGAAQVGFVYLSDAHGVDDVDVVLTTDEDTHSEIAYPIAVLKDSKQSDAAKQFEDFLLSDAGQAILENMDSKKLNSFKL